MVNKWPRIQISTNNKMNNTNKINNLAWKIAEVVTAVIEAEVALETYPHK